MHNHIGAMIQRTGLNRCRIGIVDHSLGAVAFGDGANGGNVDQTHVRIGRGFEIDYFGLVGDRGLKRQRIGQVDMRDRNPEPAQPMLEE